ncbi:MAG TPA: PhzF family phenazine biosynthesis protein [Pseudobdellovibrionaceae bacterium]|nr:PhzF family phenazine biosynthesis protein [Pseudobdellovibrionaceae bacterium]
MKFKLVDAFTEKPLGGNPCAVLLGADNLSADKMLAIAQEMNQSETAFLMKSQNHTLRARYFTPSREIPLAGHPTIASIHAAIESGFIDKPKSDTSISLELNEGPIRIDVEAHSSGIFVKMFQRKPQFLSEHDPKLIAEIFNIEQADLIEEIPIQTVTTGTPMLLVPLKSKVSLRKVKMNPDLYMDYFKNSDFFGPHLFCLSGESKDASTFARHPGTPPSTSEDAFTGSATGCMGAYLWKYGLIKERKFIAEQGHWMGRPGRATVEAVGEFENLESVIVSGTAVTVIDGDFHI